MRRGRAGITVAAAVAATGARAAQAAPLPWPLGFGLPEDASLHGWRVDWLLGTTTLFVAIMFIATKTIYGPLNHSPRGASVARHLFYNDYLKAIAGFGWREQHSIVFDHLIAPTAFYISRDEFAAWWREIGVSDADVNWHNSNSWRGFGRIK